MENFLIQAYKRRKSEIDLILTEWSLSAGNLIKQKRGEVLIPHITTHILTRLLIALDVAQLIDDHLKSSVHQPIVHGEQIQVVPVPSTVKTEIAVDDPIPKGWEESDDWLCWFKDDESEHDYLDETHEASTVRTFTCEDHTFE